MSGVELLLLLPYLVLGAAAVAVLLVIAARRDHRLAAATCAGGLICAFAALFVAAPHAPHALTSLFVVDGFALFYTGLLVLSALVVTALSYGYLRDRGGLPEEYYALLLLATLGAAALSASDHFASFFLALETLSISLLGLIAYPRAERPAEASIKYLLLSGASSALLLFGMALVYNELGTLSFSALAALPGAALPGAARGSAAPQIATLAGVALILVGIGFKLSLVPFHLWAPDVYEGAPAPVSAFVAVVSKCAVVALLLRYFGAAHAWADPSLVLLLTVIAVASILMGNLLALLQSNFKRLLAYSSIAHLGYVLVAFLAGGALAIEAVSVYLVAYAIMTLGAFGIVTLLSPAGVDRDADRLEDYRGLFWSRPWLALVLTAMLLSLAGIPLTLGFIGKFYAVTAGVGASLTALVTALVVGSIIGLFYYLRVIVMLIASPVTTQGGEAVPVPAERIVGAPSPAMNAPLPAVKAPLPAVKAPPPAVSPPVSGVSAPVLGALLLLLVGLGVYPAPLVGLIRLTADTLSSAAPLASAASSLHPVLVGRGTGRPALQPAVSSAPSLPPAR